MRLTRKGLEGMRQRKSLIREIRVKMTGAALKVLLVEDTSSDAELLELALRRQCPGEFIITHVGCWVDAVQLLREGGFDVLLLDMNLPDSCGAETFVRARSEAPRLPIVVLTGILTSDPRIIGQSATIVSMQDATAGRSLTSPAASMAGREAPPRARAPRSRAGRAPRASSRRRAAGSSRCAGCTVSLRVSRWWTVVPETYQTACQAARFGRLPPELKSSQRVERRPGPCGVRLRLIMRRTPDTPAPAGCRHAESAGFDLMAEYHGEFHIATRSRVAM